MKQIIKDVLEDVSVDQPNLGSEAAREMVASLISTVLKSHGYNNRDSINSYLDMKTTLSGMTTDIPKEDWICDYCGKSTYDVDYEYLAGQTRHLECQLKYEQESGEQYTDDADLDRPKKRDNLVAQAYNEFSSDGLPEGEDRQAVLDTHKLEDEIVDNKGSYIYESYDGGKTVFRRPFGDYNPEHKEEIDWETKELTGRKFTEYNNGNWGNNDER